MKVSIRIRLALIYTGVLTVLLTTFGIYTYLRFSSTLHDSLDHSLKNIAWSVSDLIEKNYYQKKSNSIFGKPQTAKDSLFSGNLENSIISATFADLTDRDNIGNLIYENILLNPKNYMIRFSDTSGFVWQSENLKGMILGPLSGKTYEAGSMAVQDHGEILSDIVINDNKVKVFTLKKSGYSISVGYTLNEINHILSEFFNILIFSSPFVIILSFLLGIFLSKVSLRPVDEISKTADAITASNLSERLKPSGTNDEIDRLTSTLNSMIERLEDSFSKVNRFTSDASHELRTPLTILRGELEIALHKTRSTEEYEAIILSALEEVARLNNVVETLLEISRADSGRIQLNIRKNNLSTHLHDIADDIKILAWNKDIDLTREIDDDVVADYDSGRMHQAILNIAENAIKYTDPGGKVNIKLHKNQKNAHLSISDTGRGMDEKTISKIFDRFYRDESVRLNGTRGIGLGLSIVRWIIDAHEARINVESEAGKGSKFVIILPLENN